MKLNFNQRAITRFDGAFRFLSNFYPAEIIYRGIVYPTAEHAYQATKMLNRGDRLWIAEQNTPGRAKRLGNLLPMRSDWEEIKIDVMRNILRLKFQIPELKVLLLLTDDAHLEEGNTWGDQFWGAVDGVGQNQLGKLLTEMREEIKNVV